MSVTVVKTLATGAAIYAVDNDDKLFPADKWTDAVIPYLQNDALLVDPSRASSRQEYRPIKNGFAFFKPLASVDIFNRLENPDQIPMFFPSEIRKRNAASSLGTLPAKSRLPEGHAIAFADASARYVKTENVPRNVRIHLTEAPPAPPRARKRK